MSGYGIFGLVLAVFLVALFLASRFSRRTFSTLEKRTLFSKEKKSAEEIWRDEGNCRAFETADYTLPDEDFFEREETEPMELSELLEELPTEEAKAILKETGLLLEEEHHG